MNMDVDPFQAGLDFFIKLKKKVNSFTYDRSDVGLAFAETEFNTCI